MHALTPAYSFRSPAQISKTTPLSCHLVFSITEYRLILNLSEPACFLSFISAFSQIQFI